MYPTAREAWLRRKHPAHGVQGESPIVFVTVCTKGRARWLPAPDVHELLLKVWTEASAWLPGRYMVMPDHIHLFAAPGKMEITLDNWVKYWKSQFTKKYRQPLHQWQDDHWDTRMRTEEQYVEKLEYAINNPVRQGLVERAEDWPYQGEIHELRW